MKTVRPKSMSGWNMSIMQLFGSGPKFTITCGNCSTTFSRRIQMVEDPGCPCPHCGMVNILPLAVNGESFNSKGREILWTQR